MRTVRELIIKGKRVLVRCDFKVPIDKDGTILDDFKIRSTIPTIQYLIEAGAKVILMSHLGEPAGKVVDKLRLNKVQEGLLQYLDLSVTKAKDCIGKDIEDWTKQMQPGEVLLLENLRFHPEEEKGDLVFTKKLARLGDIFLNDAFASSHRNHASFRVAKYLPCGAGLLLDKEVRALNKIKDNPNSPLIVILAGLPKGIKTKIKFINSFIDRVDCILLGNLVADELQKYGFKFGLSEKIIFPLDSNQGLDIGPETIKLFKQKILSAKTIFWSGPLGRIEDKEFSVGTREMIKAIVKSQAFSVAGGGETSWFINQLGLEAKFGHLSTGGDALLSFLSGEKLPGLEMLD
ncbi:phosphoglycerate kinase [Candidatus Parcubacteria bacterium]|nr:phosphoglycerate kinase [Patescibacteria group bacterium]MBU4466948.1 phosphoglycerate kinase [Patescibacteria group bacterium]MCG2688521.1 phosphoglycerate kinase [Candidatus Parcubacteria bacterium]